MRPPIRQVPRTVAEPQNAKGPATAPTVPSHGSTNPQKDTDMNEAMNTTVEHSWEVARRLAKDLSDTLAHCSGGNWYAHIMPPNRAYRIGFGAYPMGSETDELAIDRVNRLAWELAHALNDYQNGMFQARIYPSEQAGYAVMFTVTKAAEGRGMA